MSKGDRDGLITGLVIGTVIGVVGGILIAPNRGKDTQKIIKRTIEAMPEIAEDLTDNIKVQTDRISSKLGVKFQETIDRLQIAIAAGIIASREFKNNQLEPLDYAEEEMEQPIDILGK